MTIVHALLLFFFTNCDQTNFPQYVDQSTGLYVFLIFGINLPWTLSCLRNYIVVPTTATQRTFIIVFDTIVNKPVLRNELLLQFLSVQGFINSEYFTLVSLLESTVHTDAALSSCPSIHRCIFS